MKVSKEEVLKLGTVKGTVLYQGAVKTGVVIYNETKNLYNVKGCGTKLFALNDIKIYEEIAPFLGGKQYNYSINQQPTLDSNIEEALESWIKRTYVTQRELEQYGDYEKVIPHIDCINTIKQALQEKDECIKELETSDESKEQSSIDYYNEMRKYKSKLNAIEEWSTKTHMDTISRKQLLDILKRGVR